MKFEHWVKAKLLPGNTWRGRMARRLYRVSTPWRPHHQHPQLFDALAASKAQVRFVQVGSNDAGYGDPLSYFIQHRGWRGLMIEPLPHTFARLCERYKGYTGLQFANIAIASEAGVRPFYHLRRSDEPGLPPWYDMLGSFSKENVLKHQAFLSDIPERIVETSVRCTTLSALCGEQGVETFDILHIDVEGYDYEVLKTVDLDRHRPALIVFEYIHLSEADDAAVLRQLHDAGYLTQRDPVDIVAIRHSSLAELAPLAAAWARVRRRSGAAIDAPHAGLAPWRV